MNAIRALETSPWSGRRRPEFGRDIRALTLQPLVVFYRVPADGTTIEIARVIDGRRDLGTVFF
ncbi:MAG: type II toxin-antitoxin system RelE/ParE family toxin [Vulcanimicrobiaceae bacterium]